MAHLGSPACRYTPKRYRGLSTRRGGLEGAVKARLPEEMQKIMGRWRGWSVNCYKSREILRIAEYTETCFEASFKLPSECHDIPAPPFVRNQPGGPHDRDPPSHGREEEEVDGAPALKRRRRHPPT